MATLADVARRAGVSPAAASCVLSKRYGNMRVGKDAQRRILDAAQELNYVPARHAQNLARRRSGAIALVAPTPSGDTRGKDAYNSHHLHPILSAMEYECGRLSTNFNCLISHWTFDSEGYSHPRPMLDRSVDGVILTDFTRGGVVNDLLSLGLPCVQLGSNIEEPVAIERYYPDLVSAVETAVQGLVARGHRRIHLYAGIGPGPKQIMADFESLKDQLPDAALSSSIIACNDKRIVLREADAFLDRPDRPTALITLSTPFGISLASMLAERGVVCPDDFSLVGVVLKGWPQIYLPGKGATLSTIESPHYEIARMATRGLLDQIMNPTKGKREPRSHMLPCTLDWKDSVMSI